MDTKTIGLSIASLRQQRGWTQRQLARQMGVSHQAVSKWENGDAAPDVETLVKLARLFGVSIDRLINPQPEDIRVKKSIFSQQKPVDFQEDEDEDDIDDDEDDMDEDEDDIDDDEDDIEEDEDEMEEEDGPNPEDWHFGHEGHRHHHHHIHHNEVKDPKLAMLMQMAPFISRDVLDEKFMQYLQKNTLEDIRIVESLAPFVSREVLSQAIEKVIDGEIDPHFVIRIAPFIGREDLMRLIRKTKNQDWIARNLGQLAPFLPREYLDEIIRDMEI